MIYINTTKVKRYLIVAILGPLALFLGFKTAGDTAASYNSKVTCSMFDSQKSAQSYFNHDPKKFHDLDRDSDGTPCESLS